jgi:hypothetical protein
MCYSKFSRCTLMATPGFTLGVFFALPDVLSDAGKVFVFRIDADTKKGRSIIIEHLSMLEELFQNALADCINCRFKKAEDDRSSGSRIEVVAWVIRRRDDKPRRGFSQQKKDV